jgi:hypothetical protein
MKQVMWAALIAAALVTAPTGQADPDPHKPDLGAGFCPGGGTVDAISPERSCDGVPYDNGAYWRSFKRGGSVVMVQCVMPPPPPGPFGGLVPQPTWPQPAPPGSCG